MEVLIFRICNILFDAYLEVCWISVISEVLYLTLLRWKSRVTEYSWIDQVSSIGNPGDTLLRDIVESRSCVVRCMPADEARQGFIQA